MFASLCHAAKWARDSRIVTIMFFYAGNTLMMACLYFEHIHSMWLIGGSTMMAIALFYASPQQRVMMAVGSALVGFCRLSPNLIHGDHRSTYLYHV